MVKNLERSLVERIIELNKPFILYHTYLVNKNSLSNAISENKSMDLDVSVDNKGVPYLGHSPEFYEKSGEEKPENMPFNEALKLISKSKN